MRKLFLTIAAAAAVLSAGSQANRADAMPLGAGARAAISDLDPVEQVAWCYYPNGWNGPGYYRCGAYLRRGYGWYGLNAPVVVVRPARRVVRPIVVVPSDARLKRDIVPIERLANGLELYRYRYVWSDTVYVGVMAQDVRAVRPDAVTRGADGFLLVNYKRLGLRLQTWDQWSAAKGRQAGLALH
jgi:hypothetical protein